MHVVTRLMQGFILIHTFDSHDGHGGILYAGNHTVVQRLTRQEIFVFHRDASVDFMPHQACRVTLKTEKETKETAIKMRLSLS